MSANIGQYKTTYLTGLTDEKSTDVEGLGALRLQNGKLYRWVKLSTGTSATVATVVNGAVGFLATDTALTTVCTDVTDCFASVLAGLTLSAGATTDYYMWIQVGGISGALANNVESAGTAAVGEAVCLSTSDNTCLEVATVTQPHGGIVTDVTSSANKVFLTCPT